jgi:hypothetical protein
VPPTWRPRIDTGPLFDKPTQSGSCRRPHWREFAAGLEASVRRAAKMEISDSAESSMPKAWRQGELHDIDQALVAARRTKPLPHEFVLDAIAPLSPTTRPMFGCLAVYVEDKIVLILRDKPGSTADNGVWLATATEHHESLRHELPSMRSVQVLGAKVTEWQLLPADAPDFEEMARRACELILSGDPRIGKVPKKKTSVSPPKSSRANAGRTAPRSLKSRK